MISRDCRKVIILGFVAFLVTACGAAPATTAPTSAPAAQATVAPAPAPTTAPAAATPTTQPTIAPAQPTAASSPTNDPNHLTLRNISLAKPQAIGDARVEHRPVVNFGDSALMRLTITGASELSDAKTAPAVRKLGDGPDFVYKLAPGIELYPWMWADLQVAKDTFEVTPPGRERKPVIVGRPTAWSWSLKPLQKSGQHDLVVHIGTIINQDDKTELEVETTDGILFTMTIQDVAPTAPPLAAAQAANRGDTVSTIIIVIAVIIGAVATIVALLVRQERAEQRRKVKS